MSKIKICGLFREEDINYVNEALPDYIGFIINFPKSHRSIDFNTVNLLKSKLNNNIKAVGVFVNETIENIEKVKNSIDIIQLHGQEDENYISEIRKKFPTKELWKAFKISNEKDFENALESSADIIILDNGYGTGEVFDWGILNNSHLKKRKFALAGGINIDNIKKAINDFNPELIDISSGVETDKIKDYEKIMKIVKEIR